MKIIFLDIDGVLNHISFSIYRNRLSEKYNSPFDYLDMEPIACSNLQLLLEADSQIRIVISSSWRKFHSLDDLRRMLTEQKIDGSRVIDKTPSNKEHGLMRGHEIQTWLNEHPEIKDYAIIDDDGDMLPEQKANFVQTDVRVGFSLINAEKVAEILRSPDLYNPSKYI